MGSEAQSVNTRCENCGATMAWDGKAGMLKCASCGATKAGPAPAGAQIIEHDLIANLAARKPRGPVGAGDRQSRCNECGATVEFPEGTTATKCSFCDSPHVLAGAARSDGIQPESLIPFATDRAKATAAFKGWLGKLWFRPSDLSDKASVSELRGVYLPYWTFSAHVSTRWTAERGTRYQEQESYVDSNQQTQVRSVTKVRWESAAGAREDDVTEHLVCASKGLPAGLISRVRRFDTNGLVAFAPEFLSGFAAESYAVELGDAWKQGQREIVTAQEARCLRDVGGDEQRYLNAAHTFSGTTFKHVLLPVWIAAFRYGDKVHRFLVNGQTGDVSGEAPVSWTKVLLFIGAIIAVIAAIWYFATHR